MKIRDLTVCLPDARFVGFDGEAETKEIKGLSADSRLVKAGDLFFCLTGGKIDSHMFAKDAFAAGAVAVVSERALDIPFPQIVVPDSRRAMGKIGNQFYGRPAEKLKIVGITGTNGKTTTSYMLASVLKCAGKSTGVIGTLGIVYAKKNIAPSLTTPDPLYLHKVLADMVKEGVEYVVMEVSAHALYYHKDEGISYAATVFTNLTQDHLDFFGDMKSYGAAKMLLFAPSKGGISILNTDDKTGTEIAAFRKNAGAESYTYGLYSDADITAETHSETARGSEFLLRLPSGGAEVSLKITGRHNLYNAMAAAGAALVLGVDTETIGKGLSAFEGVKGRLEFVGKCRGADVFVDFAHTPDGLEKSLGALKEHLTGRLICLFGCGGNRDKTKRPVMGRVAAANADFCVLTSDNPRYEDPSDILSDIEKGFLEVSDKFVSIPDRKRAIRYALSILEKGDMLLVAGKGGEEYQEIMGIKYAYNDNAIIREILRSLP